MDRPVRHYTCFAEPPERVLGFEEQTLARAHSQSTEALPVPTVLTPVVAALGRLGSRQHSEGSLHRLFRQTPATPRRPLSVRTTVSKHHAPLIKPVFVVRERPATPVAAAAGEGPATPAAAAASTGGGAAQRGANLPATAGRARLKLGGMRHIGSTALDITSPLRRSHTAPESLPDYQLVAELAGGMDDSPSTLSSSIGTNSSFRSTAAAAAAAAPGAAGAARAAAAVLVTAATVPSQRPLHGPADSSPSEEPKDGDRRSPAEEEGLREEGSPGTIAKFGLTADAGSPGTVVTGATGIGSNFTGPTAIPSTITSTGPARSPSGYSPDDGSASPAGSYCSYGSASSSLLCSLSSLTDMLSPVTPAAAAAAAARRRRLEQAHQAGAQHTLHQQPCSFRELFDAQAEATTAHAQVRALQEALHMRDEQLEQMEGELAKLRAERDMLQQTIAARPSAAQVAATNRLYRRSAPGPAARCPSPAPRSRPPSAGGAMPGASAAGHPPRVPASEAMHTIVSAFANTLPFSFE